MACCQAEIRGAGRFFSRFARRHRKHYQKKGLDKSQRQLVEGLRRAGYAGATILEIGCGVGYLHQWLLKAGALSAVGVDLSQRMLEEARLLAHEQGLIERVTYRQGDFVELADSLNGADVCLLDKVVCCYPDPEHLIEKSLARTRRVYALTYPRDRWYTRLGVALTRLLLWLVRSPFRNYVHDPVRIEAWIAAAGFRKHSEDTTLIWLTQVYVRE